MNHSQNAEELSLTRQLKQYDVHFVTLEQTLFDYNNRLGKHLIDLQNIKSALRYYSHVQTPLEEMIDSSDLVSFYNSIQNEFPLLDEIECLDFDNYNKLTTALLEYQLNLPRIFVKSHSLEMTLACGSKENILTLMKNTSLWRNLIETRKIFKFFEMIIFRHGYAMAEQLWNSYADHLSSTQDIHCSQELSMPARLLWVIMQSQKLNVKNREFSERKALDRLCANIASSMTIPSCDTYNFIGRLFDDLELALLAAYFGLEETTKIFLSNNDLFTTDRDEYPRRVIALQFSKFKNNDFIFEKLSHLFGNVEQINRGTIMDQLRVLSILLHTMNPRHPRTLEFKNKIENMSSNIFDSILQKLEMHTNYIIKNNYKVSELLSQIFNNAVKFKSPYFCDRALFLESQIKTVLNWDTQLGFISNKYVTNLTRIMIEPSSYDLLSRLHKICRGRYLQPYSNCPFSISFSGDDSPLFGSKAILAINNLFSDYVVYSSLTYGPLVTKISYIRNQKDVRHFEPLEGYASFIAHSVDKKYQNKKTSDTLSYSDEVFCMNLAVMADTFLTTNKERVDFLTIIKENPDLKDFFLSSYQKGCSLWVWNHLMQRQEQKDSQGFKAIRCFQQVVETDWLDESPYHNVWTMSVRNHKNPGFKRAHDKYEKLAMKLSEIRPTGLRFGKKP